MPFRDRISRACAILLNYQNEDGGIPATKSGDPSGCWTTADALEAFINSGVFVEHGIARVRKMVEFLLASQIGCGDPGLESDDASVKDNPDVGGWPLIQGVRASTMATGHAVGALRLALKLFDNDPLLIERIDQAIRLGVAWLEKYQNDDGGWGAEPSAGADGRDSRIVATYYALCGFWYRGGTFENSTVVRRAADFFRNSRNRDGSWGFSRGLEGDISNTARATTALIRSQYCEPSSPIVQAAAKFIIDHQEPGGLWDLGHEGFLYEDASGEVIYNNSCVFDALMCLLMVGYRGRETNQALVWFLESQEDNGLWHLSSPKRRVKDIYTWSTAEWIDVVDLASKEYVGHIAGVYKIPPAWRRRVLVGGLVAVVIVETAYIFGLHRLLADWWKNLSQATRELILVGIVLALVVNLAAAFMYDTLRRWFNEAKRRILRFLIRSSEQ